MGNLVLLHGGLDGEREEGHADRPPVDAGKTRIGILITELSTPNRPGEPTPFRRGDAPILLEHLLKNRRGAFWDEDACQRVRQRVLTLMTALLEEKLEYVDRKLTELGSTSRAAEAWVGRPLEQFTDAIRASYKEQQQLLNDNRLAFLRAAFLACLFEANAPSVTNAPALTVAPRPHVPHATGPKPPIPFRPRR